MRNIISLWLLFLVLMPNVFSQSNYLVWNTLSEGRISWLSDEVFIYGKRNLHIDSTQLYPFAIQLANYMSNIDPINEEFIDIDHRVAVVINDTVLCYFGNSKRVFIYQNSYYFLDSTIIKWYSNLYTDRKTRKYYYKYYITTVR